jgi:hypothetical protein
MQEKIRVLKGSTDYRPASNSYPVKVLQIKIFQEKIELDLT